MQEQMPRFMTCKIILTLKNVERKEQCLHNLSKAQFSAQEQKRMIMEKKYKVHFFLKKVEERK